MVYSRHADVLVAIIWYTCYCTSSSVLAFNAIHTSMMMLPSSSNGIVDNRALTTTTTTSVSSFSSSSSSSSSSYSAILQHHSFYHSYMSSVINTPSTSAHRQLLVRRSMRRGLRSRVVTGYNDDVDELNNRLATKRRKLLQLHDDVIMSPTDKRQQQQPQQPLRRESLIKDATWRTCNTVTSSRRPLLSSSINRKATDGGGSDSNSKRSNQQDGSRRSTRHHRIDAGDESNDIDDNHSRSMSTRRRKRDRRKDYKNILDEDTIEGVQYWDNSPWKSAGLDRRGFLQTAAVMTSAAIIPVAMAAFPQLADAMAPSTTITGSLSSTDDLVWNPLNRYGLQDTSLAANSIYNPRFTAYLARFLLNNDPASIYWWKGQSNMVSKDAVDLLAKALTEEGPDTVFDRMDVDGNGFVDKEEFFLSLDDQKTSFSNFQASVSYGLRNYPGKDGAQRLFKLLTGDFCYSIANKRQIALLFSLLDSEQPTVFIKSLIGETDNSSVISFDVAKPGSGYDPLKPPAVTVEKPPFLDDVATAKAFLKPTGRIFRIKMVNSGKGYVTPPEVIIAPPPGSGGKTAKGIAVLRSDKVAAIIITDPGKGYLQNNPPGIQIEMPPSSPTAEGNTTNTNPLEALMNGASAEVLLEFGVSKVEVTHKGSGYGQSLPLKVTVEPPPPRKEFANFGQAAVMEARLSDPPDGAVITSWLPTLNVTQEVTKLLPDNLVPTLDPCLGKFYISPIPQAAPGYCVYFDKDEFEVYPSEKIKTYFSFLDGPRARYPVEKEKPLDFSVYLRFALCGGTCGSIAHAFLVPIDVVKTRMQSNPRRYKQMIPTFKAILAEEGKDAFLLGAGATFVGYLLYGGVSFGLTEFFKRKFIEFAGPSLATLYPVPILLTASAGAACFAATAVTPFEALRIKTVTIPGFPKTLFGAISRVVATGEAKNLLDGVPVLLLAEIPFMMTKFAVFDASSKFIFSVFPAASDSVPLSLSISLVSGMIAGVAASLVSQPCDTILVEVNDGKSKGKPNIPKIVKGLLKQGGLGGLYNGAIPRSIKSAANIAIQFFLYDFCKRLAHVSTDDIKVFFDVMSGLELNYTPAMDVVNIITSAATSAATNGVIP